ncbi:hypothetical protein JCM19238_3932 [Vibrio ponticus]|nr:hypothetical protein JCM19238_3932 [Vibrio ponticus]
MKKHYNKETAFVDVTRSLVALVNRSQKLGWLSYPCLI